MRNVYIGLAVFLVLSIALFVTSFVYLDRSRHETIYYNVLLDGKISGTIRVDRFVTEDRLIYKSSAETPFSGEFASCRSRLDLGRKYLLQSYTSERTSGRFTDAVYVEGDSRTVSFLATYGPWFSFTDRIPVKKDVFIFEDDSPMTYMPLVENYDFSIGRSQSFNALLFPPLPDEPLGVICRLPPMKRYVTLTSIRDEYLKVDSRKIKTENLLVKIRDHPAGALWVAKSDRAIIRIELPAKGVTITRSFRPRSYPAAKLTLQDPRYLSEDVMIKGGDADIPATFTTPTKDGRFPAVLLAGGPYPADRDAEGLFGSLADYFSKNGFCVLRYDRRGTGSSKYDASSVTGADDISDARAALCYLAGRASVDPRRLALVCHGSGAACAPALSSDTLASGTGSVGSAPVSALVVMAPILGTSRTPEEISARIASMAADHRWPEEYVQLIERTIRSTAGKVGASSGDWTSIAGNRVFLKAMRDDIPGTGAAAFEKITVPVYTVYGDRDAPGIAKNASDIDAALERGGNRAHTLKAFGYLGRFFGKTVNDGARRIWQDPDKAVLENIRAWLEKALAEKAASQSAAPGATEAATPPAARD